MADSIGRLSEGSLGFLVIDKIKDRASYVDKALEPDLEKLLDHMNPKDEGGVNGTALSEFTNDRPILMFGLTNRWSGDEAASLSGLVTSVRHPPLL